MGLLTTVDRRGADAGVAHALQVTPDNFARAESDMQFMTVVKRGGFGRLTHERDFPPAGRQSASWADGDVLRSRAIFDLELGPVTVTIPPTGERFVSIEALDEDHYTVAMFYGPGTYSFSFDNVSTRYVLIVVRIMVDPANRADLARVHELQETILVSRQGVGRFVIPNWDPVSQAKVRVALQLLANTVSGDDRTFGGREEVDPVRHLAQFFHRSPDQLNNEDLREYFLYLTNEKQLSRSTTTVALCGIKFFYERTLQQPWPTLELVRPGKDYKLPVVLSREEVRRVLDSCTLIRQRTLLMTVYGAGLRVGELVSLRTDDQISLSLRFT